MSRINEKEKSPLQTSEAHREVLQVNRGSSETTQETSLEMVVETTCATTNLAKAQSMDSETKTTIEILKPSWEFNEEEKANWLRSLQGKASPCSESTRSQAEDEEVFAEGSIQDQDTEILQKFNKGTASHLSSDKYPKVLRRS